MATVKAMTITVDSLVPRPKLDCNVGYDVVVKGASVVVYLSLGKQWLKNLIVDHHVSTN